VGVFRFRVSKTSTKGDLTMSKKIIFIDLDNTIIETASGKKFPTFIGDMKFKNGILDALKNFVHIKNPKYLFIVDNQNGIEKKQIIEDSFIVKINFITRSVFEYIDKPDINITNYYYKYIDFYYYKYKKPNIGILERSLSGYLHINKIDKKEMLMIGDASGLEGQFSDSDKKTAENFGIDYCDVNEFIKLYKTEVNDEISYRT
jgi:DNA 3'-phosphatase